MCTVTGKTVNPLTRTPHSTCHQHTASIDADYTTERVDGQYNRLFNIYQTPPTSTDLPLNSTNYHQTWTPFEITVRKHLSNLQDFNPNALAKITNPTFRINAKTTSYQATQPINRIATDRGYSVQQNKGNKIFSST